MLWMLSLTSLYHVTQNKVKRNRKNSEKRTRGQLVPRPGRALPRFLFFLSKRRSVYFVLTLAVPNADVSQALIGDLRPCRALLTAQTGVVLRELKLGPDISSTQLYIRALGSGSTSSARTPPGAKPSERPRSRGRFQLHFLGAREGPAGRLNLTAIPSFGTR